MIRIFYITLILVTSLTMRGQQAGVQPDSPAFIGKYAELDFKGKFAVLIDKDATNNYFLLDFTKFPTRFDRVYFMTLSFSRNELINIDPDITKTRVCFMANGKYSEVEVIKLFDELKKKVNDAST